MVSTEWLEGYVEGRSYEIARIIKLLENGCCQHDAAGCPQGDELGTQEDVSKLVKEDQK